VSPYASPNPVTLTTPGKQLASIGWEKPPEDDGKLIEAKPASED
jgi:hypothetical protein